MGALFNMPRFQEIDSTGRPLAGGLLYTYAAGTTTPKATYADRGKTTPNTNPVVLDSNGEAVIYTDATGYKMVLKDAAGVLQWSLDEYYAPVIEMSIPAAVWS